MKNWLVTTRNSAVLGDIHQRLRNGPSLVRQIGDPVPMGENEVVFEVEGPDDLDRKLKRDKTILGVHPSSPMVILGR